MFVFQTVDGNFHLIERTFNIGNRHWWNDVKDFLRSAEPVKDRLPNQIAILNKEIILRSSDDKTAWIKGIEEDFRGLHGAVTILRFICDMGSWYWNQGSWRPLGKSLLTLPKNTFYPYVQGKKPFSRGAWVNLIPLIRDYGKVIAIYLPNETSGTFISKHTTLIRTEKSWWQLRDYKIYPRVMKDNEEFLLLGFAKSKREMQRRLLDINGCRCLGEVATFQLLHDYEKRVQNVHKTSLWYGPTSLEALPPGEHWLLEAEATMERERIQYAFHPKE